MTQFKRTFVLFFLLCTTITVWGQSKKDEIVKVTYRSSPISQYKMTEDQIISTPSKASTYEFMKGITDYYSLYINLEDYSSVYILDSTVQVRPLGWENPRIRASLADTVLFTLKTPLQKTLKHEWIMNQTFFSEGEVGNIEWELTNEEKKINGLNCKKAKSRFKNYPMLIVWYTKDIPISNGPSIYQGVPGLVILAEDYFRTIKLHSIEYTEDREAFKSLYSSKLEYFEREKERGKHYEKEPLLLVKKGDLARTLYEHYHKKPYKGNN